MKAAPSAEELLKGPSRLPKPAPSKFILDSLLKKMKWLWNSSRNCPLSWKGCFDLTCNIVFFWVGERVGGMKYIEFYKTIPFFQFQYTALITAIRSTCTASYRMSHVTSINYHFVRIVEMLWFLFFYDDTDRWCQNLLHFGIHSDRDLK